MNFQTNQSSLFVRPLYSCLPFVFTYRGHKECDRRGKLEKKLAKVALKVFEKKIKKAQELKAEEEARLRIEAAVAYKEWSHIISGLH